MLTDVFHRELLRAVSARAGPRLRGMHVVDMGKAALELSGKKRRISLTTMIFRNRSKLRK
jgi:hypothetical protein